MVIKWQESGARFAGTVVSLAADGQTCNVLYDERVRGKEVYENNIEVGRLELWSGDEQALMQVDLDQGEEREEEQEEEEEEEDEEGTGGRRAGSSTRNARRVSSSSDAMGLIRRLAKMREDGDLDVQTVTLTPAQIVQLHDSLAVPTSKFSASAPLCCVLSVLSRLRPSTSALNSTPTHTPTHPRTLPQSRR